MLAAINAYIRALNKQHRSGRATEPTHRAALQALLEAALPGTVVTNEPKQIAGGAPDFGVSRVLNSPLFGLVETKNIGVNLDDAAHSAQLQKYAAEVDNLVFTDYLRFRLLRGGKIAAVAEIGTLADGRIKRLPQKLHATAADDLAYLFQTFADFHGHVVTTADQLAQHMAVGARKLAREVDAALRRSESSAGQARDSQYATNALHGLLENFRDGLIPDLQAEAFADIYAQTVTYGMFTARLRDSARETFTRRDAAELIPVSNELLRRFFQHIAGYDPDERIHGIGGILDAIAGVFQSADVAELMQNGLQAGKRDDPFLHFYETFLAKYNAGERKRRGVYATPGPVVDYIVGAVDEVLRRELGMQRGLASADKTPDATGGSPDKSGAHKVQILDPATGTGTFLAAVIKYIRERHFAGQEGLWPEYARDELLPRLQGFEILMAPYAMAHVKLEMVLRENGYEPPPRQRLRVFLTNALQPESESVFNPLLSHEADAANRVKRDAKVMVVLGNPPYSVGSANRGKWIQCLLRDYKKDLHERKQNLDDDYIKFIRYGEHLVSQTGEGVLAYISNNSFLSGVTHRQMRRRLMSTFDKIYILDLHGNTRTGEMVPDGGADQNVFDIMQGVSINIFVKCGAGSGGDDGGRSDGNGGDGGSGGSDDEPLAQVFHHEIYGARAEKFAFLRDTAFADAPYRQLAPCAPHYFFTPKDFSARAEYEEGFSVAELFPLHGSGIISRADQLAVQFTREATVAIVQDFLALDVAALREKYSHKQETKNWNFADAKADLMAREFRLTRTHYRAFDFRYAVQTTKASGFISRPGYNLMRHLTAGDNVCLTFCRTTGVQPFAHALVTKHIFDGGVKGSWSYGAPLYAYDDDAGTGDAAGNLARKPNLDAGIVQKIAADINLQFAAEADHSAADGFTPFDVLDYVYAVLHSPAYRAKFASVLQIDFPRVPYPTSREQFRAAVAVGRQLRALHLMESAKLNALVTTYGTPGSHLVDDPAFEFTHADSRVGRVRINARQSIAGVPQAAWELYIGGYQPAQKYLKDRKGRILGGEELWHYQRMIVALNESVRLMGEADAALR